MMGAGKDVMDQSVTLNIDGRDVAVPPGTMVLEAAKRAGIIIPSLCNQEKLLPAGLCRLCLVEIEKMRGLQAACATAVREGMIVHTDTPAVLHNRRMVLELLCTNHPLDCPVCDAAGDCRLQDYVFQYGRGESRFVEQKRHKGKAIRLGPAVVLDQERCVLCQRCVRYCEEVLDDRQLAVFQRGAQSRISTLPGKSFDSVFSGNVVDLCPVGAMTDRIFRFKGRTWELKSVPSTCALCPVNCRVTMDTREGRILRVRGREAPEVNDGWLCDLGRTAHGYGDHPERLRRPLVRRDGNLEPATWEEALAAVAKGLRGGMEQGGPGAVAALGSPRLANEAAYLLGKLMRAGIGSNNVDGASRPLTPAQATLAELRRADLIVLFLADPSEEAPILELWVKQALRRGARLHIVHTRPLALGRYAAATYAPRPGSEGVFLAGVLAAAGKAGAKLPEGWEAAVAGVGPTQVASVTGCEREAAEQLAAALSGAQRAVLAYGSGVRTREMLVLLSTLAAATGARLLGWDGGPNSRGAADMGLGPGWLPGQAALDDAAARERCAVAWGAPAPRESGVAGAALWQALQERKVRALYVAAADPLGEAPDPEAVRRGLEAADFVVVQDSFLTLTTTMADVVLPAAVWGEEDGTMTNLAGHAGALRAAVAPLGSSRPHWRIVADVARALEAKGTWDYAAAGDVLAEVGQVVPAYAGVTGEGGDVRYQFALAEAGPAAPAPLPAAGPGDLALVTGPVLFDRDVVAAHVVAVAGRAPEAYALLNPHDAERLGMEDGALAEVRGEAGAIRLRARVDPGCLAGTVFVPEHLSADGVNVLGMRPGAVAMVTVKPLERAGRASGEEP